MCCREVVVLKSPGMMCICVVPDRRWSVSTRVFVMALRWWGMLWCSLHAARLDRVVTGSGLPHQRQQTWPRAADNLLCRSYLMMTLTLQMALVISDCAARQPLTLTYQQWAREWVSHITAHWPSSRTTSLHFFFFFFFVISSVVSTVQLQ